MSDVTKLLRRAGVVCALALALTAAPVRAAVQPPAAPAAQDGFVPVTDLPPDEKLPATPLVLGAYAFIWLAALGYVYSVWRRVGAVERELAALRRSSPHA